MTLQETLSEKIKTAVQNLYSASLETIEFQATRKDFEGDITVVVFPMLRIVKGNPVQIGEAIGNYLIENVPEVSKFNVVQGFLNIVLSDAYYLDFFKTVSDFSTFGILPQGTEAMMVEYSSPNTNKPLHLGHIRNVLLGYSVAEILKASGKKVYKTQIINDRGIHICKSMLAWKKFGKGEKPSTYGRKGDHLVGKYYVRFNEEFKNQLKVALINSIIAYKQALNYKIHGNESNLNELLNTIDTDSYIYFECLKSALVDYINYKNPSLKLISSNSGNYELIFSDNIFNLLNNVEDNEILNYRDEFLVNYLDWINDGILFEIDKEKRKKYLSEKVKERVKSFIETHFEKNIPILRDAQEMLLKWELGDPETVRLWKKMNGWVYEGFEETYKKIGVDFDSYYYESDTYLLGKDNIEEGLKKGVFYRKEDGSVWCDLTADGLDEKIVLRSDGTAVYMTQDIGTAIQRVKDHPDVNGMIYTVGNEQDYHFKVLFLILKKLGYSWAENLYHLSYGMVDLPSGKMKSREGTVVDADDLVDEMVDTARAISEELGKIDDLSTEEKAELYKIIGLGALKYYILKVDPKKRILFDPKESVDFQGNTGPFIQYTYARIQSILRKAGTSASFTDSNLKLEDKEKELLKQLQLFPEKVQEAASNYSPALIANYTYDLVKLYNSFFQNISIFGANTEAEKNFRVALSKAVGEVIKSAFGLLGIGVPERM
ncbi:MAG: arginine--tRNA ligase [Flavobacteriaceae bacterium]|nr:arginine--tRNA ligase [Flavobacteriaceae bacterium]|tara:strand:- start:35803 stop:37947 length:2145 start_codon:yes stop_codon:yes gene_type:complete